MKSPNYNHLIGCLALASVCLSEVALAGDNAALHHDLHHDQHHSDHDHSKHLLTDGPISAMRIHIHEKDEWMLSYRYMFMDMDGMKYGTSSLSPAQVFAANYTVTPTRMTMDMHMLGLMYAPTDNITLMAMLPYISYEMDHQIFSGADPLIALNGGSRSFKTKSSGFGDFTMSSLIRILDDGPHHVHAGIGVSLPTASIAERDIVPGPGGRILRQLPAAMQPGSGSIDLLPSLTYSVESDHWGLGLQLHGIYRTQTNHHDYRLGDRFGLDTWLNYLVTESLTMTTGMSYLWEGELSGTQSDVSRNPPFAPTRQTVSTAFGENYGGQRVEALFGLNVIIPTGPLEGHRIGADIRVPLWEDANGYRLGVDYTVTVGWQMIF